MNRTIVALLCCFLIPAVLGHGYLTSPVPRQPQDSNQATPCETGYVALTAPYASAKGTVTFINKQTTVSWITPHIPQSDGGISISIAPQADQPTDLVNVATGNYDDGYLYLTFASTITPGAYTMQWAQQAPGPYYNCAQIWIIYQPPMGCFNWTTAGTCLLPGNAGGFDSFTNSLTCSSGFCAHDNNCYDITTTADCTKNFGSSDSGAAAWQAPLVLLLAALFFLCN